VMVSEWGGGREGGRGENKREDNTHTKTKTHARTFIHATQNTFKQIETMRQELEEREGDACGADV